MKGGRRPVDRPVMRTNAGMLNGLASRTDRLVGAHIGRSEPEPWRAVYEGPLSNPVIRGPAAQKIVDRVFGVPGSRPELPRCHCCKTRPRAKYTKLCRFCAWLVGARA